MHSDKAEDGRRAELGAFLRNRRGRVGPADVGIAPGGRRRTPGLSTAVGALTWQRLPQRIHPFLISLGFACAAVGYAAMALSLNADEQVTVLLEIELAFTGIAFGLGYSPLLTVVLSRVPISDAADASGLLTTFLNLGQVLGVATLGSLYLSSTLSDTSGNAIVTTLFGASAAIVGSAVAGVTLLRHKAYSARHQPERVVELAD